MWMSIIQVCMRKCCDVIHATSIVAQTSDGVQRHSIRWRDQRPINQGHALGNGSGVHAHASSKASVRACFPWSTCSAERPAADTLRIFNRKHSLPAKQRSAPPLRLVTTISPPFPFFDIAPYVAIRDCKWQASYYTVCALTSCRARRSAAVGATVSDRRFHMVYILVLNPLYG
jgi:hypothetical protein